MHIVLFEPRIPPNTGTIARLCAATGTPLHLIEPLGFSIDDKHVKRAGLDYWPHVDLHTWSNFDAYVDSVAPKRMIMTTARQGTPHHEFTYQDGDALIFGPETTGLPLEIMDRSEHHVRIPIWGKVRSLNLSNAASILLYEAYRQVGILDGK